MDNIQQVIKQFLLLDEYFIKNLTGEYILFGKKNTILDFLEKSNRILDHHDKYELIRQLSSEKNKDWVYVFEIALRRGILPAKHVYLHKYVGNNPEEVLNNFEYSKKAIDLGIIKEIQLEYKIRNEPTLDWTKEILDQWK